jgi:ribosomal protein L39E
LPLWKELKTNAKSKDWKPYKLFHLREKVKTENKFMAKESKSNHMVEKFIILHAEDGGVL